MNTEYLIEQIKAGSPEVERGIFHGMQDADYFAIPAVSSSMMKAFQRCPHAWRSGLEFTASPSMAFGSMIDCRLLTPDRFDDRFTVSPFPDFRKKEAKEWRDIKLAEGIEIIKPADLIEADKVVEAVKECPRAFEQIASSEKQVAIVWDHTDERTGIKVPCKGLIDMVSADGLIDLKTTKSADPFSWRNTVRNFRYDLQAAFYLDGFNASQECQAERFRHIVIESSRPYEVATYELSKFAIEVGRNGHQEQTWIKGYNQIISRFLDCVEFDQWSGFTNDWQICDL